MNLKLNVKQRHLNMLYDIFNSYCPKAEIWAFGSRLTDNYHDGSDLDLVIKSFNDDTKQLYELKELINDSNIPFLTDILEFEKVPDYFQENILKKYIKIYPL